MKRALVVIFILTTLFLPAAGNAQRDSVTVRWHNLGTVIVNENGEKEYILNEEGAGIPILLALLGQDGMVLPEIPWCGGIFWRYAYFNNGKDTSFLCPVFQYDFPSLNAEPGATSIGWGTARNEEEAERWNRDFADRCWDEFQTGCINYTYTLLEWLPKEKLRDPKAVCFVYPGRQLGRDFTFYVLQWKGGQAPFRSMAGVDGSGIILRAWDLNTKKKAQK